MKSLSYLVAVIVVVGVLYGCFFAGRKDQPATWRTEQKAATSGSTALLSARQESLIRRGENGEPASPRAAAGWSFTWPASSEPESLTSDDGVVVLRRLISGAFPARVVEAAPTRGDGSPELAGSLSFDHGGVPPANPHFTEGALFHGALASELNGDGMLDVWVRMRGDKYWPRVYQCVAALWEKGEVGGGGSASDNTLALALLVFDGRWCAWGPGGVKIESTAAATPGKWQRVGVARQDGWLFLLVDGVVVGRSRCATSPAIGSVCLGGYGVWRDPKGDTPMWCMGGEMASVRIVPLTPEQGVGQISPPTYRRSLPELSASPRPAADWATLALTPLKLNSILADCSTKENTKCQDANVVLASGGFGQCLDAANGGWLKYQPDYFSDSEQEVTVEAWLFLEDPTKAGTIVDRPGMYRLESRPAEKGGGLVWSLRVGGLWRSVELPLPTKGWISVCASFDGQTMRLSAVEDGKTVQAEHLGLMARNGSALWLGAAKDGKDGFPGGIGSIRVSRNVRGAGKFMAAASFPAAINMRPVEPVPYTDSIAVARPDGIVDQMRKALPSPRMSIPPTTHAPVVDGEDNDECWRSVPVESTLPITVGYEPPYRRPSRHKVETRLTRDADHLYGFMRLIAPGSGVFTIGGNSKDDYWGALKDCVELFLVPGNSTSIPYYQICFGLGGGLHDGKGRDKNWNAANLRHAVKVHGDSACVEFSIPFTDFGQTPPAPGTLWRGNVFARLGGNQASWAYLWPLPDTQFHFGTMEFTAPRETEQPYVPCSVRGRLVDEKGAPVVWNIPHAAGGVGVDGHLTRTDDEGYFEIDGLEAKMSTLQSFIPLCDAVAFRMELKPGMNDLGAIVQSPRRTLLPRWRATEEKSPPGAAVAWFRTWISSPPDMGKAPRAAQWANPEPEAVVAPGETEDVAAAFVALKSLEKPTACVNGMKTGDGKLIPAEKIRVRWVTRQLVISGPANPPEDSNYVWKYLRDEAPDKLLKDDVAMLAITIAAPADARPGDYRGELQLRAAGGMAAALPIRVTVAPFKLTEAVKQVGMYNYTVLHGGRPVPIKSKEQQRAEMEDLRDHNCSLVVMIAAGMDDRRENSESILEACRAAGRAGMKKIAPSFSPFTNGHPWDVKLTGQRLAAPGFLEKCKAFEAELDTIEKEYPGLEILPTWGDEITLWPEPLKAWDMMCESFRSFCPDRRIYISAHPLHVGAMKSMKNQPQVVNWSVAVADRNELRSAEAMDAWANNIKNQGYAENWCYNNNTPFLETPATRLAAGYWLWASPFDAHVPWTYYTFEGDPLNPLDGGAGDLGFAYPVFDGGKWTMIPSLQWQSWRDGYNDLRWAATLEKAIDDAKALPDNHPAKAKAKTLLKELRQYEGSVDAMAAKFSPDDFTTRRRAILEAIRGLTDKANGSE